LIGTGTVPASMEHGSATPAAAIVRRALCAAHDDLRGSQRRIKP
jgi:hypothetical protein